MCKTIAGTALESNRIRNVETFRTLDNAPAAVDVRDSHFKENLLEDHPIGLPINVQSSFEVPKERFDFELCSFESEVYRRSSGPEVLGK